MPDPIPAPIAEILPMPDAEVLFYRAAFAPAECESIFHELVTDVQWTQESIQVPGKVVPLPRLTAWYGNDGKAYAYSGLILHPHPWIPLLVQIRERVQSIAGVNFNSVELTPGSVLLMRGTTQHFWKHQIPKTKQPNGPRINLTFRIIK